VSEVSLKKVAKKRSSADTPGAASRAKQHSRKAVSKAGAPKSASHKAATARVITSRVTVPKVAVPKVAVPKVAVPKVAAPKVAVPKVAVPMVAVPKVAVPKVALPKAAAPRVAAPRVPTGKARVGKAAGSPAPIRQGLTSGLMPLHEGIVYGPVRSRRLGRSLGINLTPAHLKLCSFNCSYCQYGWSEQSRREATPTLGHWPSPAAVAKAVSSALKSLAAQGDHVERLTLAGHGEPTMHPKFKDVVTALRKVRDELARGVPLAVLSNASTLERADVREALADLDERYMKLDAGDTATLRSVNGATLNIEQLVAGLKKVPGIVIQSMFVKDRTGRIDNTGDLTVINWVGALDRIKPKAVQVYTIDRAPAFPYLQQVSPLRLREIAQRVRLAGFPCDVFGIPEAAPEAPKS
jgi:wyosine [tRNA(Phe)-imidazoG37] synthetase (radical SAM superfamily)